MRCLGRKSVILQVFFVRLNAPSELAKNDICMRVYILRTSSPQRQTTRPDFPATWTIKSHMVKIRRC